MSGQTITRLGLALCLWRHGTSDTRRRLRVAEGYRGSIGAATLDRVRLLTPTVAILDGTWSITGAHDAQGHAQPPERGIYVAVATQTGRRRRITALREQTSAQALRMDAPPRP